MSFFRFATNKSIRRLRWVMVFTMVLDLIVTLVGQPTTYWHDPDTANEANHFIRLFMIHGYLPFVLCALFYSVGTAFLVSVVPTKLGLLILFSLLLSHYFGASTWFEFHFHYGMSGPVIYAIFLAVLITLALDLK